MIRAVLFDAGDVLYTRASSSTEHARRLLAQHGYATALGDEVEAELAGLRHAASIGRIPPGEYWRNALERYGVSPPDRERLLAQIDDFADAVVPAPSVRDVLVALRHRGNVLGVITDTMYPLERKLRWLDRIGVGDLLEVVSCSTALGVKKPDPAIYLDALERARVPAGDAAFVGHSAVELGGARAVGMPTIGINPDANAVADRTVTALPELLDLDLLEPRA